MRTLEHRKTMKKPTKNRRSFTSVQTCHTHTHCARASPPNATRRPSVLMMVCAVRLGTCNRRSRKERPSPHFLVSGIFAHDHTPQAHTHTSIHTYNTHTHAHTQTDIPDTHTHAKYTHTHTSHLDTTHTTHTYTIIHTYTNTYMHPHTRIPPQVNLHFASCCPFTLAL